jgi:hypothetical protein
MTTPTVPHYSTLEGAMTFLRANRNRQLKTTIVDWDIALPRRVEIVERGAVIATVESALLTDLLEHVTFATALFNESWYVATSYAPQIDVDLAPMPAILPHVERLSDLLAFLRDGTRRLRVVFSGAHFTSSFIAEIVEGDVVVVRDGKLALTQLGTKIASVDPGVCREAMALGELVDEALVGTTVWYTTRFAMEGGYEAPVYDDMDPDYDPTLLTYTVGVAIDQETTVTEMRLPPMDRLSIRNRVIDECINALAEHPLAAQVTVSFRWGPGAIDHVTHRLTSHTLPAEPRRS